MGEDFRKDLITVPSCELHNSAKSLDDEFLMVSLAGIVGNNSIGYAYKLGKVDRALRRRSYKLLDKVLVGRIAIDRIQLSNNAFLDVLWGCPDMERLRNCFQAIAFGLHFHDFRRRFLGVVKVHLGYINYHEGNPRQWNSFVKDRVEIELAGKSVNGANPRVFNYQVSDVDCFGLYVMRLRFYGGLDVHMAFVPDGSQLPPDPVSTFLKAGVPVVLTLGDKAYSFEPKQESGSADE